LALIDQRRSVASWRRLTAQDETFADRIVTVGFEPKAVVPVCKSQPDRVKTAADQGLSVAGLAFGLRFAISRQNQLLTSLGLSGPP